MKSLNKRIQALFLVLFIPTITQASTGGGGFGGGLQLVSIGQAVVDFLQGPIALIIITIGVIVGGVGIMMGRQNDDAGYKRLGKVAVGGSIMLGASSLVSFFFSGAVI